jgi:competence protein ComEA
VVSVVGQVAHPGLVTLAPGARVADALAAAGGLLPDADAAAVNAAAVLTDGQQIAVGVPGAAAPGPTRGSAATGAATGPVDLNTATVADLDALPGVGPVLAQRIVDHRAQHGRFTSVDQLDDVPGIGPALFAQLAPLVRV